MARQLRLDAPGLTHHVTARGNDRRKILLSHADCLVFLALLAVAVRRFNWNLHAWVLMVNHYHLVVETAYLMEVMRYVVRPKTEAVCRPRVDCLSGQPPGYTAGRQAAELLLRGDAMSEMSLGLTTTVDARPEARRYFFDVSPLKLVVMSVVTFGIYQLYWFYQHWRLAKERGENVIPVARALFAIFFVYPLFKEVRQTGRSVSVDAAANAGALATLFILLQFTFRLPDPFWLVGLASAVPLALIQRDIVRVHRALGVDPTGNDRFSWLNILGVLFGGLWILLVFIGMSLPDAA